LSEGGEPQHKLHVAVAGGGLIGLSISWRLAQQGFRVSLFEKGSIGKEASWAGAGMLAPGGEFDSSSPLLKLAIESRRLYPDFVRELEQVSQSEIDYQECGALELAYGSAEWEALRDRSEAQAVLGIRTKALDLQQVRTFWPRVRLDGLTGAMFYSDDAIVNPRDLVTALKVACRRAAVTISENSAISNIDLGREEIDFTVRGLSHKADAVVVAAGAWSGLIQLRHSPPLPASFPVKGHLIGFDQPDQTCGTIVRRTHTYLLQRANGLLIAGASVEDAGWDARIDPEVAASLAEEASFLMPHLAETSPSQIWIGFRPGGATLSLGAWHSSRLYLAYGHYRNGILLAPVTADRIAQEINANLRKR
jgi:glycine oxidase